MSLKSGFLLFQSQVTVKALKRMRKWGLFLPVGVKNYSEKCDSSFDPPFKFSFEMILWKLCQDFTSVWAHANWQKRWHPKSMIHVRWDPTAFKENVCADTKSVSHFPHCSWKTFVMIILLFQKSAESFHHSPTYLWWLSFTCIPRESYKVSTFLQTSE